MQVSLILLPYSSHFIQFVFRQVRESLGLNNIIQLQSDLQPRVIGSLYESGHIAMFQVIVIVHYKTHKLESWSKELSTNNNYNFYRAFMLFSVNQYRRFQETVRPWGYVVIGTR